MQGIFNHDGILSYHMVAVIMYVIAYGVIECKGICVRANGCGVSEMKSHRWFENVTNPGWVSRCQLIESLLVLVIKCSICVDPGVVCVVRAHYCDASGIKGGWGTGTKFPPTLPTRLAQQMIVTQN